MTIRRTDVGEAQGHPIERIVIGDEHAFHIVLLSIGAAIIQCHAPGAGGYDDVILGHEDLNDALARRDYHGATCGRFAGRISNARFSLDGTAWPLEANEGTTSLHGGHEGFDRHNWSLVHADEVSATFIITSAHGDGGYPGTLEASVTYRIDGPALVIEMTATCDRPTVVNLVNHAYWNLEGHGAGTIGDHVLNIEASRMVAATKNLLPTGELPPVAGTPFDFRTPKPIGRDMPSVAEGGYDLCFCVDGKRGELHPMATAFAPKTGRKLEVWSTEPGLQFYTAEHFDGSCIGKGGVRYGARSGFALETQTWPDAPNRPDFPSARLDPGQTYSHVTELRFSAV
ncbi:Aldose 1-epimerase [hydrothermal vent metagenome]|uniref:Aldose 1-epimerase n=1 Tax=hydrothermal vent metagenome TaxID=652676 RepID=A0A3B0T6V2_9ZZZZ